MRVEPISSVSQGYESETSEIVQRFQQVTQIIGRQRAQGSEEVNLLLRNNEVDQEVITRLSRLYDVQAQTNNGPSMKVTVRFR
jgi:hypothetical protein